MLLETKAITRKKSLFLKKFQPPTPSLPPMFPRSANKSFNIDRKTFHFLAAQTFFAAKGKENFFML